MTQEQMTDATGMLGALTPDAGTTAAPKSPKDQAIGAITRLLDTANRTAHKARGFSPELDQALLGCAQYVRSLLQAVQAMPADVKPKRGRVAKGPERFVAGAIYKIKEGQRARYLKILQTQDQSAADFAQYVEALDSKTGLFQIDDGGTTKALSIAFADTAGEVIAK